MLGGTGGGHGLALASGSALKNAGCCDTSAGCTVEAFVGSGACQAFAFAVAAGNAKYGRGLCLARVFRRVEAVVGAAAVSSTNSRA